MPEHLAPEDLHELAEILNHLGTTVDSCHPGAAVVYTPDHGVILARCAICQRIMLSIEPGL